MSRFLSRLRSDERGIALLVALAALVVLGVAVTAMISYTSSNQRSTNLGTSEQSAGQITEAGLNQAYSILNNAATQPNGYATLTAGTLIGCAAGLTTVASCTPQCVSVAATCPTATSTGVAGTADIYGFFVLSPASISSVAGAQFATALTPPTAGGTWFVSSTGYARDASTGSVVSKRMTSQLAVTKPASDTPNNVAVWNHLYSTAPQGAGCEVDVTQDSVFIDVPVYVTGDLCLEGHNDHVWNNPNFFWRIKPQLVDLNVLGHLIVKYTGHTNCGWFGSGWFSQAPDSVGECKGNPITSGTVVGGCATSVTATSFDDCGKSNGDTYNYYVRGASTSGTLKPPATDTTAYNTGDPGPMHACRSGQSVAPPAAGFFDTNTTAGDDTATTNLTPLTSYTCISAASTDTPPTTPTCQNDGPGQISWNASTDQLTISGEIYIDGNVQITQDATYVGCGSLYVGGAFTMDCPPNGQGSGYNRGDCSETNGWNGWWWSGYQGTCPGFGGAYNGNNYWSGGWGWSAWGWGCSSLCAVRSCNFSDWDPTETNLAIVADGNNLPDPKYAIRLLDDGDIFQGSLYAPPDATTEFGDGTTGSGDYLNVQGPEVSGKFTFGGRGVTIRPLPPVDPNLLPPGAPLDPNASRTLSSPSNVWAG